MKKCIRLRKIGDTWDNYDNWSVICIRGLRRFFDIPKDCTKIWIYLDSNPIRGKDVYRISAYQWSLRIHHSGKFNRVQSYYTAREYIKKFPNQECYVWIEYEV